MLVDSTHVRRAGVRIVHMQRDVIWLTISMLTLALWTAGIVSSQLGWLMDWMWLAGAGILVWRIFQNRVNSQAGT